MEDGWVLAQALRHFRNDRARALPLFDATRLPYYSRMYAYLASEGARRAANLSRLENPSYDERVANKIVSDGGKDMSWIYGNDIGAVWGQKVAALNGEA